MVTAGAATLQQWGEGSGSLGGMQLLVEPPTPFVRGFVQCRHIVSSGIQIIFASDITEPYETTVISEDVPPEQ